MANLNDFVACYKQIINKYGATSPLAASMAQITRAMFGNDGHQAILHASGFAVFPSDTAPPKRYISMQTALKRIELGRNPAPDVEQSQAQPPAPAETAVKPSKERGKIKEKERQPRRKSTNTPPTDEEVHFI